MKMKKTDIGVVAFMYAVCAFFYVYSFDLSESSKSYPMFTIALLFGLTTLYLVQMILAAKKYGVESGIDSVFAGFLPKQFILSVVLTLAYVFLVDVPGLLHRYYPVHDSFFCIPEGPGAPFGYSPGVHGSAHLPGIRALPWRASACRNTHLRRALTYA